MTFVEKLWKEGRSGHPQKCPSSLWSTNITVITVVSQNLPASTSCANGNSKISNGISISVVDPWQMRLYLSAVSL